MAYSFRHITVVQMQADPVSATCVVNPVNCISTNCIIYLLTDWIKIQMPQLLFRASGLVRGKALEEFHILEPRFLFSPKLFLSFFFLTLKKESCHEISMSFFKSYIAKILIIRYILLHNIGKQILTDHIGPTQENSFENTYSQFRRNPGFSSILQVSPPEMMVHCWMVKTTRVSNLREMQSNQPWAPEPWPGMLLSTEGGCRLLGSSSKKQRCRVTSG